MSDDIEMRCKSCCKVLAYIRTGSRIAQGVAMYCEPCNAVLKGKKIAGMDIPSAVRKIFGRHPGGKND